MAEWADGLDTSVAMDENNSDFFGFTQVSPIALLTELKSRWARAMGRMDVLDYWNWARTWWFYTDRNFKILVYPFEVGPRFSPNYSLALLVTPFLNEDEETFDPWAYGLYKRELYDVVSEFGGQRLPMELVLPHHYETPDFRRYTEDDFRID